MVALRQVYVFLFFVFFVSHGLVLGAQDGRVLCTIKVVLTCGLKRILNDGAS